MNQLFERTIETLKRMDSLIRTKATGTPNELARKLNVSPSTIYEYLLLMKNILGAPIHYCKIRKSYYYSKRGKLNFGFYHEV
jgi:predicted DNA-binding transcriptional regulator YafY